MKDNTCISLIFGRNETFNIFRILFLIILITITLYVLRTTYVPTFVNLSSPTSPRLSAIRRRRKAGS